MGMAEPHVVTALIKKRSDLAAEIEHLQNRLRQTVIQLDHVESTLRIFKPDIDLGEFMPRRIPTAHHAFRGEVSRIILDTLRATECPLSTAQLAEAVMRERGLDVGDKVLRRTILRRTGACLRHWKHRGSVKSFGPKNEMHFWEIAR
jgi:hypothetical protein